MNSIAIFLRSQGLNLLLFGLGGMLSLSAQEPVSKEEKTDSLTTAKKWNISEQERRIFDGEYEEQIQSAEDSTEYEVIVFDPGFNAWLNSVARPRGYYSLGYLEQRNLLLVNEWNLRFQNPSRFDPILYENRINYEARVDYGYEVNYILYNYFLYFQRKNGVRLTALRPSLN